MQPRLVVAVPAKNATMTSSQPWHDPDDLRQASRVGVFTAVMMFWALVFVPIYLALGGPECALVLFSGCAIGAINLIALKQRVSTRLCGNILCGAAFYVYTAMAVLCGGRWAPTTIWYVSIPVLSLVVSGAGWACYWTAASLLAIIVFSGLAYYGIELNSTLGPSQLVFAHNTGLVALVLCLYALAYVMTRFERQSREILREANRWLQQESSLDPLTRIANRRCFDQVFEQEWQRHRFEQLPLSVVLIDLDYFKEFNDLRGHLAGDNVLRLIASAIQAGVRRRDDMVARFGGEEFVVILPNTAEQHVPIVVERMRGQVGALAIQHPNSSVDPNVTISVGTATAIPSDEASHFDLLRQADEALYRAKARGRNRVEHANPATEGSPLIVPIIGLPSGTPFDETTSV
jgi:diguanylate cyclase (GGDEF)-like protein